jgi:hypothetical protein
MLLNQHLETKSREIYANEQLRKKEQFNFKKNLSNTG